MGTPEDALAGPPHYRSHLAQQIARCPHVAGAGPHHQAIEKKACFERFLWLWNRWLERFHGWSHPSESSELGNPFRSRADFLAGDSWATSHASTAYSRGQGAKPPATGRERGGHPQD